MVVFNILHLLLFVSSASENDKDLKKQNKVKLKCNSGEPQHADPKDAASSLVAQKPCEATHNQHSCNIEVDILATDDIESSEKALGLDALCDCKIGDVCIKMDITPTLTVNTVNNIRFRAWHMVFNHTHESEELSYNRFYEIENSYISAAKEDIKAVEALPRIYEQIVSHKFGLRKQVMFTDFDLMTKYKDAIYDLMSEREIAFARKNKNVLTQEDKSVEPQENILNNPDCWTNVMQNQSVKHQSLLSLTKKINVIVNLMRGISIEKNDLY